VKDNISRLRRLSVCGFFLDYKHVTPNGVWAPDFIKEESVFFMVILKLP